MIEEKNVILILASRLLSYPTKEFFEMKPDMDELVDDIFQDEKARQGIKNMYEPFFQYKEGDLQELYVETFDLKTKLGLYLTAHEMGDSNKRGAALIKLQKIINESGFERDTKELSDYIPMLLEFIAVSEGHRELERLFKRVSVVIKYLLDHIHEGNPYREIFAVLMKYVFPVPTSEELQKLEHSREEADLEEMPYPLLYG